MAFVFCPDSPNALIVHRLKSFMSQAIIYLNFNGNCAEAMRFYRNALGGELELQPIGTSPMAAHMPNEKPDNILHSSLESGGIIIMASDMVYGTKAENGNACSICLVCDTEAELNGYFDELAVGGTIVEQPARAPWGDIFGMLTDKFGKSWMFNCGQQS